MTIIRDASFIKKKTLSDKLIEIREKNNMSQAELAEKLFTSRSTVAKWETGRAIPSDSVLDSIAKLYNVDRDYFKINRYLPPEEVKSKELVIEKFSFKTYLKVSYKLLILCVALLVLAITLTSIYSKKHIHDCTEEITSNDCDIKRRGDEIYVYYNSTDVELNSDFVIPNKLSVKNHISIFPYRVEPTYVTISGPTLINSLSISKNVQDIKINTTVKNISVDPTNKWLDSRDNCNCLISTEDNCLIYAGAGDFTIPESVRRMSTRALAYITKEEIDLGTIGESLYVYEDFYFNSYDRIWIDSIISQTLVLSNTIRYIDFGNYCENFYLSRKLDEAVISKDLVESLMCQSYNNLGTVYYKGTREEYYKLRRCSSSCICKKNVYFLNDESVYYERWHYDENHRAVIG